LKDTLPKKQVSLKAKHKHSILSTLR
jgi:hypothetical protein